MSLRPLCPLFFSRIEQLLVVVYASGADSAFFRLFLSDVTGEVVRSSTIGGALRYALGLDGLRFFLQRDALTFPRVALPAESSPSRSFDVQLPRFLEDPIRFFFLCPPVVPLV